MLDHGRKSDAASARARGSGRDGKDPAAHKIGGNDGDAWQPHEALTDADTETLGQENLPVFCGKARHEGPEHKQNSTGRHDSPGKSRVGGAPRNGRDEEQTEDLEAADPRDVGCRTGERGFVVVLKHAKACAVSPRHGDDKVTREDLGPGLVATIWRRRLDEAWSLGWGRGIIIAIDV